MDVLLKGPEVQTAKSHSEDFLVVARLYQEPRQAGFVLATSVQCFSGAGGLL